MRVVEGETYGQTAEELDVYVRRAREAFQPPESAFPILVPSLLPEGGTLTLAYVSDACGRS